MPKVTLECLIVREPYASLIAYGPKRWEFRSYPCRKRTTIGIVASRRRPIPINPAVAKSRSFPRGALLALANISDCRKVNSADLAPFINGRYSKMKLHDVELEVCESPLGEPVEDIVDAANDDRWESYVWQLTSVVPLKNPQPIRSKAYSPWKRLRIDLDSREFDSVQPFVGQSTLDLFAEQENYKSAQRHFHSRNLDAT
jgi:hypothetical protein